MKPLKSIIIFYRSNKFRNYSIMAGLFVSVLLISSLSTANNSIMKIADQNLAQSKRLQASASVVKSPEQSTKYHNFLASYFLQESTVKRTVKKKEERESVFSNLKDVHKIIVSRRWSIF